MSFQQTHSSERAETSLLKQCYFSASSDPRGSFHDPWHRLEFILTGIFAQAGMAARRIKQLATGHNTSPVNEAIVIHIRVINLSNTAC